MLQYSMMCYFRKVAQAIRGLENGDPGFLLYWIHGVLGMDFHV